MARLNQSVLGKVLGSIGDITFRQRNGKNYISLRPKSFIPGTDNASLLRRSKFSLVSKISKTIYSNLLLYSIWKTHTPKGRSVYNNIIRYNYPYIGNEISPETIQMVPRSDFKVVKSSIHLDSKILELEINPPEENSEIDVSKEQFISLYSFIYLNKPISEGCEKSHYFLVNSEPVVFILSETVNFKIILPWVWENLFDKYEEKKAIFVVVTRDIDKNPVKFSSTFY